MAEVNLTIDGRVYGIACDDGQERRVEQLGRYIDERLRQIAHGSGANNKSQLMVLTALLLADEVFDLRSTLDRAANENQQLQEQSAANTVVYQGLTPEDESHLSGAIGRLAARVEKLTSRVQRATAG